MIKTNKIIKLFRAICRLLANHCIFPSIRLLLFQCSGFNIGKNTIINMGITAVDNYENGMVVIKDRVAIAPNITFVPISNPNNSKLNSILELQKEGKIVIEDDVWLGANVTVLPGVTVGKCSVIGAGAVVTKSVEPYSIMAGVPARKIGNIKNNF